MHHSKKTENRPNGQQQQRTTNSRPTGQQQQRQTQRPTQSAQRPQVQTKTPKAFEEAADKNAAPNKVKVVSPPKTVEGKKTKPGKSIKRK